MADTQTPRKACIYTRVSLDSGEGLAVKRQEEACREDAQRRGWNVVKVLEDNSLSASRYARKKRPAYGELLEGIRSGEFDGVLAYSLDRITRQITETAEFIDLAKAHGVPIATLSGSLDLTTAQGQTVAYMGAVFAQQESAAKSERQKLANVQRRNMGRHYGRALPFGYQRTGTGGLEIDPQVEPYLREAFSMVVHGATSGDVLRYFNAQGVLTSTAKHALENPEKAQKVLEETGKPLARPWTHTAVTQILRNPVYAGVLTFEKDALGDGQGWTPYIDKETHELVKASLKSKRVVPTLKAPNAEYPLSNIIRCGNCGRPMTGHKRKGLRGYSCEGRRDGSCNARVLADKVEKEVEDYAIARLVLTRPETLLGPEVLARQAEISNRLNALDLERIDIENDLTLDRATRRKYSAEVIAERDSLLTELGELTGSTLLSSIVSQVVAYRRGEEKVIPVARATASVRAAYEALGRSQQRTLLDALGEYRGRREGRTTGVAIIPKDLVTGESIPEAADYWDTWGTLSELHF